MATVVFFHFFPDGRNEKQQTGKVEKVEERESFYESSPFLFDRVIIMTTTTTKILPSSKQVFSLAVISLEQQFHCVLKSLFLLIYSVLREKPNSLDEFLNMLSAVLMMGSFRSSSTLN